MRSTTRRPFSGKRRTASIALITLILLMILLGLVALAVDVGYIMLTRTQLQAAADAATLSGGTELMTGLGTNPVPASTVVTNGTSIAVAYASKHRNGDVASTYADGDITLAHGSRDVEFGWAIYDSAGNPPRWQMHWGQQLPTVGGYNLIGVTLRRDQASSNNGDRPLPLFFAQALGQRFNDVAKDAAAVIVPTNGIRIEPGSNSKTNIIPIAINRRLWMKYLLAQEYFDVSESPNTAGGFPTPLSTPPTVTLPDGSTVTASGLDSVWAQYNNTTNDWSVMPSVPATADATMEPLFGHYTAKVTGMTTVNEFVQDFDDIWKKNPDPAAPDKGHGPPSATVPGQDWKLEVDIFPRDDYTSGNLGSIDFGSAANDTSGLARQILEGANATDMSYYPDNEFVIPRSTQGDTGLSAGIKEELADILHECRVVFLFDGLANPGENATFDIVDMGGIRIMDVRLTGNLNFKHLSIQRCDATLSGGVGDIEEPIGINTTVFSPLILIE